MVNGERIQYPYALDENENLVYIQDVLKETRHEHQYSLFYMISIAEYVENSRRK